MISKEDIKKLAELSRLEVSDEELLSLAKDAESILSYISMVEKASETLKTGFVSGGNIMRKDENPTEPLTWTERLLSASPRRVQDYIAVKKVLGS